MLLTDLPSISWPMERPAHFLCKNKTKTSENLSFSRTNAHTKSASTLRKAGSPWEPWEAAKRGRMGFYKDPQINRKQVKNMESFPLVILFSDLRRLFYPTSFMLLVTPPSGRQKLSYWTGLFVILLIFYHSLGADHTTGSARGKKHAPWSFWKLICTSCRKLLSCALRYNIT